MAKKGAGEVNRTQAIRDYLTEHPGAMPKEIQQALSERGITVSPGLVSVVKYGGRNKGKGKKGGRQAAAKPAEVAKRTSARRSGQGGKLSFDDLLQARQFVEQVGGIDQARAALDALEQLR